MEKQNITNNNIQYIDTNYSVYALQILKNLGIIDHFNEYLLNENNNSSDETDRINDVSEDNNDVFIGSDGKVEIIDTFPSISDELLQELTPDGIKCQIIDRPLSIRFLKKLLNKPTIIRIVAKNGYHHTIFYDGKKIYDSWYDAFFVNNTLEYKDYYTNSICKFKPKRSFFKIGTPQQNDDEGYCDLFSVVVARIKARNEELKLLDKQLQTQQTKQELDKFTKINTIFHINNTEYKNILPI